MKRYGWLCVLVSLAIISVGCQGSSEGSSEPDENGATSQRPATDDASVPAAAEAIDLSVTATPEGAVELFLQLLQGGDQETAGALLTEKAREATAADQLVLESMCDGSTNFDVGQVRYVGEQREGAQITSAWAKMDGQGNVNEIEIIWIARLEREQWRIAGMATMPFSDAEPLVLNFEDPEEMQRKIDATNAEFARRTALEESRQAQLPDAPGGESISQ